MTGYLITLIILLIVSVNINGGAPSIPESGHLPLSRLVDLEIRQKDTYAYFFAMDSGVVRLDVKKEDRRPDILSAGDVADGSYIHDIIVTDLDGNEIFHSRMDDSESEKSFDISIPKRGTYKIYFNASINIAFGFEINSHKAVIDISRGITLHDKETGSDSAANLYFYAPKGAFNFTIKANHRDNFICQVYNSSDRKVGEIDIYTLDHPITKTFTVPDTEVGRFWRLFIPVQDVTITSDKIKYISAGSKFNPGQKGKSALFNPEWKRDESWLRGDHVMYFKPATNYLSLEVVVDDFNNIYGADNIQISVYNDQGQQVFQGTAWDPEDGNVSHIRYLCYYTFDIPMTPNKVYRVKFHNEGSEADIRYDFRTNAEHIIPGSAFGDKLFDFILSLKSGTLLFLVFSGICLLVVCIFFFLRRRRDLPPVNPYQVGLPIVNPENFYGREQLLQTVFTALSNNHIFLYGERRIGKSSVLRQLELRLEEPFFPVFIDLEGVAEEDFFKTVGEVIEEKCRSASLSISLRGEDNPSEGIISRQQATSLFADEKNTEAHTRNHYEQLRLKISATIKALKSSFEKDAFLVLLFDEVDKFREYNQEILQKLRSIAQEKENLIHLRFVCAGVRIHLAWQKQTSRFYNFFIYEPVPPLTEANARKLILSPVRGKYHYDDDALDIILKYSEGCPYFVQDFCFHAIKRILQEKRTKVTKADVESALLQDILPKYALEFQQAWERFPYEKQEEVKLAINAMDDDWLKDLGVSALFAEWIKHEIRR